MNETATCIITANGGNTPRPASQITYTVAISEPGQASYTVTNIKPHAMRYPDFVDTRPAAVGSVWPVEFSNGRVYCFIYELPDIAECPA
jgi:hypothetical protein